MFTLFVKSDESNLLSFFIKSNAKKFDMYVLSPAFSLFSLKKEQSPLLNEEQIALVFEKVKRVIRSFCSCHFLKRATGANSSHCSLSKKRCERIALVALYLLSDESNSLLSLFFKE